jgi:hypothetical protein
MLDGELDAHLDYKHDNKKKGQRRNSHVIYSTKTIKN